MSKKEITSRLANRFKIVDLSELWAYLDAYESDLPWLRFGQDVAFTVESFPGETFHGQISFIEPEVDRKTRTIPIRVNAPNTDALKPGMFVRGVVQSRIAEDDRSTHLNLQGNGLAPCTRKSSKTAPANATPAAWTCPSRSWAMSQARNRPLWSCPLPRFSEQVNVPSSM